MKKKLLVVLTLSLSALAFAEDLKPAQEEAKEKFENEIAEAVKAMNEKCGTKVVVKTDFQNFKEADWAGTSASSYCTPVASAIATMCESRPAYKKALTKKLTGMSCLFAGVKPPKKDDATSSATTQRNMSFEKGVFTYTMSPVGHANLEENAKAIMEKALN